ncbi:hypothetical protein [Halorubrum sp. Atlit-26R]|uniref:hypothetical protein n=1 Tax=Halorubrum sp. Atlit-26R TaxID=2282128 RepID=UPI0037442981
MELLDDWPPDRPRVLVLDDDRAPRAVDDDTERAKREVEAEAVAYVVGRYYGLDTSGSVFYLAAWESDDPEVVRERLGRISNTAEEIIDALEDGV